MVKRKKHRLQNLFLFFVGLGFFGAGGILLWAAVLPIPDLNTFEDRIVVESTKIYDRTGEVLLYDFHENVRRTVVPIEEISHNLKNATVAIEDDTFYEHYGVRPLAFLRAVLVNILNLEFSQGGSTLTQQVVKNSILTAQKKISRKLKEWVLSVKLDATLSKNEILGLYLNETPYGGNVYGVEDASKLFFGKSANEVTLAEAAYIASLPQAPTYYSPYGNNREKLEERKNLVLTRMRELDFISEEEYNSALAEVVEFKPRATFGIRAPHFVFFVQEYLEQKYGREAVERGGLRVTTTLDAELQEKAENLVTQFADVNAKNYNAHNAGLVAIDPKTGEILVMVGSRNYFGESFPEGCTSGVNCAFDPQVNVAALKPGRQPGSSFKPFVYATALQRGYTPETVVFDLETQFHSGCDSEGKPVDPTVKEEECYKPINYDEVFRGPVTFRNALAQSINIPAIKVLYLAGLRESLQTAKKMGISSLADINRYGLTLVLGGGEVSLLEMASAYGVFANEGIKNPPTGILKVEDRNGNILETFSPRPERVLEQNIALQISDILSDEEARSPAFGERSFLYIPGHDVAAKTGTTNDYRDAWIIGYTPSISVGAWAGNNDNSEMEKRVAGFIIAPLWNAFMKEALAQTPQEPFKKPENTSEKNIKPILRGVWRGNESYFIDKISGKLATVYTPEETKEERVITNVHSILYWVKKEDPRGEIPLSPQTDPQFSLWEIPVRKWVLENNIIEGGAESKPKEFDTVHRPELAPKIKIYGIDTSAEYDPTQKLTFTVVGIGNYPATRSDLFINGVYLSSTNKIPFIFSFVPNDITNIKEENEIRAIVYDSVMNRSESAFTLKIRP
ncbi:MAG: penicillin-binding protein [Parcubacteria group bacterium]|nr:penicillin-binding protein [Parcubacteria group bacterium]